MHLPDYELTTGAPRAVGRRTIVTGVYVSGVYVTWRFVRLDLL